MLGSFVVISIFMLLMNHPLAFTLSLFNQTLLICIMFKSVCLWISLILFLIFLGGILVIFIYVSSLRANEKFAVDLTSFMWVLPTIIFSFLVLNKNYIFISSSSGYLYPADFMVINFNLNRLTILAYSFIVVCLFLALLLAIDFLNRNKKPLRSII